MIEHIDIKDPRIDEIVALVEGQEFVHLDPRNRRREFRYAIWKTVCEIPGAIEQRDPLILRDLIDTEEEQILPHHGPGDPEDD